MWLTRRRPGFDSPAPPNVSCQQLLIFDPLKKSCPTFYRGHPPLFLKSAPPQIFFWQKARISYLFSKFLWKQHENQLSASCNFLCVGFFLGGGELLYVINTSAKYFDLYFRDLPGETFHENTKLKCTSTIVAEIIWKIFTKLLENWQANQMNITSVCPILHQINIVFVNKNILLYSSVVYNVKPVHLIKQRETGLWAILSEFGNFPMSDYRCCWHFKGQ